jgi:hypothetical protein
MLSTSAPNPRIVYIDYVDSVPYGTLGRMRTPVYHEILKATIAFHKTKGYTKFLWWACPPTPPPDDDRYPSTHGYTKKTKKNDTSYRDYIFIGHPKTQSLMTQNILTKWYRDMLVASRADGVVVSANTPQVMMRK